jgi:hypothetical protein
MVADVLADILLTLLPEKVRRNERQNLRKDRFCLRQPHLGQSLPTFRQRRVRSEKDLESIAMHELECFPSKAERTLHTIALLVDAAVERKEEAFVINTSKQFSQVVPRHHHLFL